MTTGFLSPEQQAELKQLKDRFNALAMAVIDNNPVDLLAVYPETGIVNLR